MPVTSDGTRVHYGGLVNHGRSNAQRNAGWVILDVGGGREDNPTAQVSVSPNSTSEWKQTLALKGQAETQ